MREVKEKGDRGYVYRVTHKPSGLMYVGVRKLSPGEAPLTDGYMGSPAGRNAMRALLDSQPLREFRKEILFAGSWEDAAEREPKLIQREIDKHGGPGDPGGRVTNLWLGVCHGALPTRPLAYMDTLKSKPVVLHQRDMAYLLYGPRHNLQNARQNLVCSAKHSEIQVQKHGHPVRSSGGSTNKRLPKFTKGIVMYADNEWFRSNHPDYAI